MQCFCYAFWCENFTDFSIHGFTGRQAQQEGSTIVLTNGVGVNIQNAFAAKGADVFLEMQNIENQGIYNNNSLSKAKTVIKVDGNRFSMNGNKLK